MKDKDIKTFMAYVNGQELSLENLGLLSKVERRALANLEAEHERLDAELDNIETQRKALIATRDQALINLNMIDVYHKHNRGMITLVEALEMLIKG